MKNEILYILDRSGSMNRIWEPTVRAVNQYVDEQRRSTYAHTTRFTLATFDDVYDLLLPAVRLPEIHLGRIPWERCQPRGMTALHDAIGRTMMEAGRRFTADPPDKVVMMIMTDGLENASTDFTGSEVSRMIKHQREKYAWEVIFAGSHERTYEMASSYSIPRTNTYQYDHSAEGAQMYNCFFASATTSALEEANE